MFFEIIIPLFSRLVTIVFFYCFLLFHNLLYLDIYNYLVD